MKYEFTGAADKENKETLESKLIYALWQQGYAYGGGEAGFEVRTALVGEGAEIQLTFFAEDAGNLGKVTGPVFSNRFKGDFEIPAKKIKKDDYIWFEVKMSKQDIKGESNVIGVAPAILLESMQWSAEEVGSGEAVNIQARFEQARDGSRAMITVYEHDADGAHDVVARFPAEVKDNAIDVTWNFLYQEDVDDIPTQGELQPANRNYAHPEYFFVLDFDGLKFGEQQESGILRFKDWVKISLVDSAGMPVANESYKVITADGQESTGSLDEAGEAILRGLPPGKVVINYPNYPEQVSMVVQV